MFDPDRLRQRLNTPMAVEHVKRYFGGEYSGAWFERFAGGGDRPGVAHRFTSDDLVAVTMLGVKVKGWGAIQLLDTRATEFADLLAELPDPEVDLHATSDAELEPLWALHDALDSVASVKHVVRSKLLARKRPRLVPVRDRHVLQDLTGTPTGELTYGLRDVLRDAEVRQRVEYLRQEADQPHLSLLRVVDIVVWMSVHGDASVKRHR